MIPLLSFPPPIQIKSTYVPPPSSPSSLSGGLPIILSCCRQPVTELQSQAARALRNLSVYASNKEIIRKCDGVDILLTLSRSQHDRICMQATRALNNLGVSVGDDD